MSTNLECEANCPLIASCERRMERNASDAEEYSVAATMLDASLSGAEVDLPDLPTTEQRAQAAVRDNLRTRITDLQVSAIVRREQAVKYGERRDTVLANCDGQGPEVKKRFGLFGRKVLECSSSVANRYPYRRTDAPTDLE